MQWGAKGIPSREIPLHSFFVGLVKLQSLQLSAPGFFARPPRQVTAVPLPTPFLVLLPAKSGHKPYHPVGCIPYDLLCETSCLPVLLPPAAGLEMRPNSVFCVTP